MDGAPLYVLLVLGFFRCLFVYIYSTWIGFLGEPTPCGFPTKFSFTTALGNCFGYAQLYAFGGGIVVGFMWESSEPIPPKPSYQPYAGAWDLSN